MSHYYWHPQDITEKSSRTSSNQYHAPDDVRNAPSFHHSRTPPWSAQRHLPPSPIQTTNSFDRYSSPLPAFDHPYDPRGVNYQQTPAKNIFEGYHYEHPPPPTPAYQSFEGMETGYCCPSPFPLQAADSRSCEGTDSSHHYVSHTVYWFDPHFSSSHWHASAMYQNDTDRKPSPRKLATSPMQPLFDSMDHPEASSPSKDVHKVPLSTGAAREKSSTKKSSKKQKAAPRRALRERGNHRHASPSQEEQNHTSTSRARKAMASWYDRYNELVDYKNEFGDTNVPQQYPPNHALGIWVNKQRMEMKANLEGIRSSMTRRRMDLLQRIEFEWAKPKGQAAWDEKFKELCEFKRRNGDCHVPTKHKLNRPLGRWVSTQRHMRKNYEKGMKPKSLDNKEIERRILKLDELGFAWSMIESPTLS